MRSVSLLSCVPRCSPNASEADERRATCWPSAEAAYLVEAVADEEVVIPPEASNSGTVFDAGRSAIVGPVRRRIIGDIVKRSRDVVSYFLLQLAAPWILLSHFLQAWRLSPFTQLYASHVTELSLGDTRGEDGDVARPPWVVLGRLFDCVRSVVGLK